VLPQGGAPQDITPPEQALADLSRMLREESGGRSSADSQASPAAGAAAALGPPESPRACSLAGSDDATPQSAASIAPFAVARASTEAPEVTRARQRAARAKENAAKAAAQRNAAAAAGGAAATGATPVGDRDEAGGGKRAATDGTPTPRTRRRITCKTAAGAAEAVPAPLPQEAAAIAASAPLARPEPLPEGAIVPLPPMVPCSGSQPRRGRASQARAAAAGPE